MSFSVEYYELENGNCPVEDFILEQNNKMQAKIFKILNYLKAEEMNFGNLFQNILRTEFLNCEAKSAMILQEFFISLLSDKKLFLQTVLSRKRRKLRNQILS